jgi:hypothetical protein
MYEHEGRERMLVGKETTRELVVTAAGKRCEELLAVKMATSLSRLFIPRGFPLLQPVNTLKIEVILMIAKTQILLLREHIVSRLQRPAD